MNDVCLYHIRVRGTLEINDIEAFCPPGLAVETIEGGHTLLTVSTDQAGMIGLIRRLHGLGFFLLSVHCTQMDGLKI